MKQSFRMQLNHHLFNFCAKRRCVLRKHGWFSVTPVNSAMLWIEHSRIKVEVSQVSHSTIEFL
jgi:hypothetical protein